MHLYSGTLHYGRPWGSLEVSIASGETCSLTTSLLSEAVPPQMALLDPAAAVEESPETTLSRELWSSVYSQTRPVKGAAGTGCHMPLWREPESPVSCLPRVWHSGRLVFLLFPAQLLAWLHPVSGAQPAAPASCCGGWADPSRGSQLASTDSPGSSARAHSASSLVLLSSHRGKISLKENREFPRGAVLICGSDA